VFGAKRLSVVRYLKQNNKTKIAAGLEVDNKVFAVTDPEKNVNLREGTSCPENTSRRASVVLADGFEDSRAALRMR
jgi:hypothetical protein